VAVATEGEVATETSGTVVGVARTLVDTRVDGVGGIEVVEATDVAVGGVVVVEAIVVDVATVDVGSAVCAVVVEAALVEVVSGCEVVVVGGVVVVELVEVGGVGFPPTRTACTSAMSPPTT